MTKQKILAFVKFSLAFGVLYYLIATDRLDLKAVATIFSSPSWLGASLLLLGFNIACNTLRWHILLQCQGAKLHFWQTVRFNFIGLFFNTFLPGAVSGDVVKAYYVSSEAGGEASKTGLMMTILLDRFVGVATLAVMSLAGAFFGFSILASTGKLYPLLAASIFLFLGLFGFGAFALSPWIYRSGFLQGIFRRLPFGSLFLKLYEAIFAYHRFPGRLFLIHLLSLIGQSAFILCFFLAYQNLGGESVGVTLFFFLVPLGMLTTAVPLFPAGLGIGQAAFLQLFQIASGTATLVGSSAFTIVQLVYFFWNMVGVIFYLQGKKKRADLSVAMAS